MRVHIPTSFITLVMTIAVVTAITDMACHAAAAPIVGADIGPVRVAAERGSVESEIDLGMAYVTGRGVEQDKKLAAYWFEKAAGAGNPVAENELGYFYQVGFGVPADAVRAVHWYQLASAGGLPAAKVNLGVAYMWGAGVQKNESLALKLFKEAADKDSGTGACYLGDMYYFGVGVKQDIAAAEHWYVVGTKLRDPRAEFNLATLELKNAQPEQSLSKVADYFRESASAGYIPAMHSLGRLLIENPKLARSSQEPLTLLKKSANAGNWKSSVQLGILARDGALVPQDSKVAYYYMAVAGLQGGAEARSAVENDVRILSAKLGSSATATIDAEASTWFSDHRSILEFAYDGETNRKRSHAFALAQPEPGTHAGRLITPPIGHELPSQSTSRRSPPVTGESEDPIAKSFLEK